MNDVVTRLSYSELTREDDAIFLFSGDTADSVGDCCMFYRRMVKALQSKRIVAVLGNHEIWNKGGRARTYRGIVSEYRRRLADCGVTLLNDDLLIIGKNCVLKDKRWLMDASVKDIEFELRGADVAIFGSTGFVKAEEEDAAKYTGIYEKVLKRNEEIALWKDFRTIYDKLTIAARGKRLIVMTHMPASFWGDGSLVPGWTYLGGHTHINQLSYRDGARAYYDNQVGYSRKSMYFNRFYTCIRNYYCDLLPDGIHKISRDDYYDFYRSRDTTMVCNREGQFIMLKRKGWHMFLLERGRSELFILQGGRIKRAEHSLDYYYDNLPEFGRKVREIMKPYMEYIKDVSRRVKQIGGDGYIHGCIVDIDFYNHIYVNPDNGDLVPYWAEDMRVKKAYRSIQTLLEYEKPGLLHNYLMYDHGLPARYEKFTAEADYVYVPETFMYSISKRIKVFQFCYDTKIIRDWDDNILESDIKAGLIDKTGQFSIAQSFTLNKNSDEEPFKGIAKRNDAKSSTVLKRDEQGVIGTMGMVKALPFDADYIVLCMDMCVKLGKKLYRCDDPAIMEFHEYCKGHGLIGDVDIEATNTALINTKIQLYENDPLCFCSKNERLVIGIYRDFYGNKLDEESIQRDAEEIRNNLETKKK